MNEIMQCKIILKFIHFLLDGEKEEEQTNDQDTIETDHINEEKNDREVDDETKEELEQD